MATIASPPLTLLDGRNERITDDLLNADGLVELTEGRVLAKHLSYDANWTAGQITARLNVHLWQAKSGDVLPEQTFRCFPDDPTAFRRPDVAFIAAGRVPSPRPAGHVLVRPDLAVEVTSPNDEVDELELKLADYRAAEIPLVWVVIPAVRIVRVFRLDGSVTQLRSGDTLTGDPVLPGFAVAVNDLFPPATTQLVA